jgi:ThiS family.
VAHPTQNATHSLRSQSRLFLEGSGGRCERLTQYSLASDIYAEYVYSAESLLAEDAVLMRSNIIPKDMPQIKIPAVLAGGSASSSVEVEGDTLETIFENHAAEHGPGLKNSVVEDGEIKEFINVFVDGQEISNIDAEVSSNAQIRVIPAASGGQF